MAANLITVERFSDYDGVAGATGTNLAINTANIIDAKAATNDASASIVTLLTVRYITGNTERVGELWVSDTVAELITAANASTVAA